jgi:hypothetical protein
MPSSFFSGKKTNNNQEWEDLPLENSEYTVLNLWISQQNCCRASIEYVKNSASRTRYITLSSENKLQLQPNIKASNTSTSSKENQKKPTAGYLYDCLSQSKARVITKQTQLKSNEYFVVKSNNGTLRKFSFNKDQLQTGDALFAVPHATIRIPLFSEPPSSYEKFQSKLADAKKTWEVRRRTDDNHYTLMLRDLNSTDLNASCAAVAFSFLARPTRMVGGSIFPPYKLFDVLGELLYEKTTELKRYEETQKFTIDGETPLAKVETLFTDLKRLEPSKREKILSSLWTSVKEHNVIGNFSELQFLSGNYNRM